MEKKKPLILNIETSTDVCSVALTMGDIVINYLECNEPNSHSKMLTTLINNLFSNTYYNILDLNAVAVSKGPGSYTGLRIGVSSAKGLAYGKDIPLLSINTLDILAFTTSKQYSNCMYLPMIDAKRMEVYTCLYDEHLNIVKDIAADIVDKDIYKDYKSEKIILCGNGAKKCKQILTDNRYILDNDTYLQAKNMALLSYTKYINKDFENIAYFEPYYLKEFIAIKSKVKGLYN